MADDRETGMVSVGKMGPRSPSSALRDSIGQAVADDLARRGFAIAAVARRFTRGQRDAFGDDVVERPFVSLGADELAEFVSSLNADVVVNCVGVLQDGARGRAKDVHAGFVARLVEAIEAANHPMLLVHLSIPGREDEDKTEFSRTKRDAERLIAASRVPHVILRPGFVIAPSAYGGSALIRALAALPFQLPAAVGRRPFAVTAVADISATIATVAARWRNGDDDWRARWDVMERRPSTVSGSSRRFGSVAAGRALCSFYRDGCSTSAPAARISPAVSAGRLPFARPRWRRCGGRDRRPGAVDRCDRNRTVVARGGAGGAAAFDTGALVRAPVSMQAAGNRRLGAVLDSLRPGRLDGRLRRRYEPAVETWVVGLAGARFRRRDQHSGHRDRGDDRIPADLRRRFDRRDRNIFGLPRGRDRHDARALGRPARPAGEDWPCRRLDARRIGHSR